MDREFVFENLPEDELRLVLKELPLKDIGSVRCTSKRMESRVTSIIRSMVNTFYIPFTHESNCVEISESLAIAMSKDYAPEKLEFKFNFDVQLNEISRVKVQNLNYNYQLIETKLNEVMIQMLLDYKNKVTSLDIEVWGNEEFLLKPSIVFESLEKMTLSFFVGNDVSMVAVCEDMLTKHAHNLSKLSILYLNRNLLVPTLPKIDSLTLTMVCDETAWNLYKQSRETLTILFIHETTIKAPSLNNEDSFKITNLKQLTVIDSNGFQFVLCNADNISSLMLIRVEDIPVDIEWPHFPRLRELNIDEYENLPILLKSKDTLECLWLGSEAISSDENNAYAVEMQRLTDLYLSEIEEGFLEKILRCNRKSLEFLYLCNVSNNAYDVEMPRLTDLLMIQIEEGFLEKILRCNRKSLEFLYLRWCNISNIDVSIRMERVKKVVIESNDEFKEAMEILSMICPNAEVVLISAENKDEIRGQVISRRQAKGFSIETETLDLLY